MFIGSRHRACAGGTAGEQMPPMGNSFALDVAALIWRASRLVSDRSRAIHHQRRVFIVLWLGTVAMLGGIIDQRHPIFTAALRRMRRCHRAHGR